MIGVRTALALLALAVGAGSAMAQVRTPAVWFGPEMPLPVGAPAPYMGSVDYLRLFSAPDEWSRAARTIRVFILHATWIEKVATPEQLREAVSTLKRLGLAIGLDLNPLRRTEECGPADGFAARDPLVQVRLIKAAGGTVDYIRLNEPWAWAHAYEGPRACHWPNAKIAAQIAEFIRNAKAIVPDVAIGDVEPLWKTTDAAGIVGWIDDYTAATGSAFPYFHVDIDYSRADWARTALELEAAIRARGIAFGLHYIGDRADASDGAWLDRAATRYMRYEGTAGGRPDHVVFQSWHDHPNRLLPQTNAASFTGLLDRYAGFQARDRAPPDTPAQSATKRTRPYEITGVVPPDATEAVIGVRINSECGGCRGSADVELAGVEYREEGDERNRVPNARFGSRTAGWNLFGPNIALGASSVLQVRALRDDVVRINSPRFAVVPGARYAARIEATVTPEASGSGNFAIIFLGGREGFRRSVEF
jgi:hypothetical protein